MSRVGQRTTASSSSLKNRASSGHLGLNPNGVHPQAHQWTSSRASRHTLPIGSHQAYAGFPENVGRGKSVRFQYWIYTKAKLVPRNRMFPQRCLLSTLLAGGIIISTSPSHRKGFKKHPGKIPRSAWSLFTRSKHRVLIAPATCLDNVNQESAPKFFSVWSVHAHSTHTYSTAKLEDIHSVPYSLHTWSHCECARGAGCRTTTVTQ